ncbi:MAG: carbohydrate kinase [Planctomycetota bacterium]|nr:MAG: carbohydrate kinase [Planctomycetota bacterium]
MVGIVVGLGEALFDLLPTGPVLGGAPLNVAVHAHQLGAQGILVSRVGRDDFGARIREELASRSMSTDHLQTDPDRPTGTVEVTLRNGEPQYDILPAVAWDRIEFTGDLEALAPRCAAVCFGSLAQRGSRSSAAILRFLDSAGQAVRLFDVNLRQRSSREVLTASLERSTMVKLNETELPRVLQTLGLAAVGEVDDRMETLRRAFGLGMAVLTRGARGTVLYTGDGRIEGAPVSYPARPNADNVGAGDACSAGLLVGTLRGWPPKRTLDLANHLGAYVASVTGATPRLPADLLARAR